MEDLKRLYWLILVIAAVETSVIMYIILPFRDIEGAFTCFLGLMGACVIAISGLLGKNYKSKETKYTAIIGVPYLFWSKVPDYTFDEEVNVVKQEEELNKMFKSYSRTLSTKSGAVYYKINGIRNGDAVQFVFNPHNGRYVNDEQYQGGKL
ncbi:hypothetical protein MUO14_14195 [Halobacillus shinanisalinarum]|uniref:DUF3592 domain-containing protein n=1 Tax=Halobacillus shinanisalinarum TaxID=2932258 RepID=A0ABY4GUR1_9BACI|nr:hypothetical protein [Halobacillus shinanisalinarum]UOQ91696.1 hypothetical protein MUO14_14195 [Halobacillus shinanisalinarum]